MNLKNALTLAFGVALLGSTAAIKAADAVLVQKTGTVTATLPNGSTKELSQGDMIPEGSTVATDAAGSAYIAPVAGAVAALQANTSVKIEKIKVSQDSSGTVTKQEVLLDLNSGDLVSTLDPEKRAVNDYKVHTPKGVAAARGTQFSATVDVGGGTESVMASADGVSFTDSTGATITINAGQITITPKGGVASAPMPIATAISNATYGTQVSSMLTAAVSAIQTVVSTNLAGLSTSAATTLATEVVAAASAANPTQAATYAANVATAMAAPTSPTASVATQAAADVAAAAAQGATSNPSSTANGATTASVAASIAAAVTQAVVASSGAGTGTSTAAAIAGTVTATVAKTTNTSVNDIAATVASAVSVSTTTVATNATNTSTNTTVQSQVTAVQTNTNAVVTTPTQVTTPINPSVVSPSG